MTRFATAALLGIALAAGPTAAQPPQLGKSTRVEFTEKHPFLYQNNSLRGMNFDYAIDQGDTFSVEATSVGGVPMQFGVTVFRAAGAGVFEEHEKAPVGAALNWEGKKGIPGRVARIRLECEPLGTVNVLITRLDAQGKAYPAPGAVPGLGTPAPKGGTAGPSLEERVQRLEAQNADIARQLDAIRRLLEQKK